MYWKHFHAMNTDIISSAGVVIYTRTDPSGSVANVGAGNKSIYRYHIAIRDKRLIYPSPAIATLFRGPKYISPDLTRSRALNPDLKQVVSTLHVSSYSLTDDPAGVRQLNPRTCRSI